MIRIASQVDLEEVAVFDRIFQQQFDFTLLTIACSFSFVSKGDNDASLSMPCINLTARVSHIYIKFRHSQRLKNSNYCEVVAILQKFAFSSSKLGPISPYCVLRPWCPPAHLNLEVDGLQSGHTIAPSLLSSAQSTGLNLATWTIISCCEVNQFFKSPNQWIKDE